MRITQGTFSFLPDLTDEQIWKQIDYCFGKGWGDKCRVHGRSSSRNTFLGNVGQPQFDLKDSSAILEELHDCRKTYPHHYIKVNSVDSTRGWETIRLHLL